MPTSIDKYLDSVGLNETVLNIRQITEGLEAEMQDLPYARPDGLYPEMTVGAVIGADETAQWSQRVTEGSGAATVRSVQGATVVWNQLVMYPVPSGSISDYGTVTNVDNEKLLITADNESGSQKYSTIVQAYAGVSAIKSGHVYFITTHQDVLPFYVNVSGLISISRGARIATATADGTTATMILAFPSGTPVTNLEVTPQIFDLTAMFGAGNEPTTVAEFEAMYPAAYYPYSAPTLLSVNIAGVRSLDAGGAALDAIEWTAQTLRAAGSVADMLYADHVDVKVGERTYQSGDESDATVRTDGTTTYYPLATPTTTPISPALPMTYKVQQGGSESVIVPDGEVSAAPVLTVAEPVNAGDEFARIWEAIQSLGYTRNAAQLSRPVSLTDTVSIDETQKDTAEIAEIDTTKEVQE